jgi:hypothetical protein
VTLINIQSGGDWYDASSEHVVLTTDVPIEALHGSYREYMQLWRESHKNPDMEILPYYSFKDWLIEFEYGREATDDEVTIFWGGP